MLFGIYLVSQANTYFVKTKKQPVPDWHPIVNQSKTRIHFLKNRWIDSYSIVL
jgi:hypothetical protein